jgi:hypothetical protein
LINISRNPWDAFAEPSLKTTGSGLLTCSEVFNDKRVFRSNLCFLNFQITKQGSQRIRRWIWKLSPLTIQYALAGSGNLPRHLVNNLRAKFLQRSELLQPTGLTTQPRTPVSNQQGII